MLNALFLLIIHSYEGGIMVISNTIALSLSVTFDVHIGSIRKSISPETQEPKILQRQQIITWPESVSFADTIWKMLLP